MDSSDILSGSLMVSSMFGILIISLLIRFGCGCCKNGCMKKKEKYEIVYE